MLTRNPGEEPERYLGRGLKTLALGLGLAAGYVVFRTSGIDASQETQNWFLFFAVISAPIAFFGIANLVRYRLTRGKPRAGGATAPDPGR